MSKQKKQSFLGGAAILAAAVVVVKIIGAAYKLPLNNILGEVGMSYWDTAYKIYNFLLTFSTAGLPLAISKLTSEAHTQGRENEKRKIFRTAIWLFFALGLVGSLLMFFQADLFAAFLRNEDATRPIQALAPAVFCVCLLACMRGYTQGQGNMTPTAISQVLENAGMKEEDMAFTLATGYGRNSLEGIADYQMSELSCHAKGASFLFPDVHTVIDIGGQDVKVLQIENGVMTNFVMNDKCAAGTGRFLDVMARVLEVKVEELGALGAQSTKNLAISSTCTVFAESEVISQLAQGSDKRDIINGIHHSVASRVAGLAHRVGAKELVVMTGGVAQNTGVVKALEEELGRTIHTSPLTQYNGALGAALFAYDRYKRAHKD